MSLRHFRSASQVADPAEAKLEPISILKPLKGIDAVTAENLDGFFQLDYPCFELIFSIADPSDPARRAVEALIARYPHVQARLLIGAIEAGHNPKINNLIRSYRLARHKWILISDNSVRVKPNFLRRIFAHTAPGVGIVTACARGVTSGGFGSRVETTFLSTFYPRWMIVSNSVGIPTVVGHSMLFRKSDADRFGGIKTLACYLAEDHMSGQAMRQLGLTARIMTESVPLTVSGFRFKDFWNRHVRWGRMRKYHVPLALAVEPFSYPLVNGICGAIASHWLFGVSVPLFLAAHLALMIISEAVLLRSMGERLRPALPFYLLLREVVMVPMWLHIWSGNTVNWRGKPLKLQHGGVIA